MNRDIEYFKGLVKKAKETGKVTKCLGQYSDRPGHYYSKPIEVLTVIKQIIEVTRYNKEKKINKNQQDDKDKE